MSGELLVTDAVRARYLATGPEQVYHYLVTSQTAEQFAASVGARDGASRDEAVARGRKSPVTLAASLDPFERKDVPDDGVLAMIPYVPTGGGNAFTEVELHSEIPYDTELTVVFRPREIYEKAGRGGALLFRVRETEIRDPEGRLLATGRAGHVMAYDTSRTSP